MAKANRPTEDRTTRRKRPPINGRGDVLTLTNISDEDRENYVYRIFNDKGTRIAQHKEYGWETVDTGDVTIGTRNDVKAGSVASVTVDSSNGTQGIVMRIPKDWYEEDQKAKQDAIDEVEKQITGQSDKDGSYGKIDISKS